MAYSKRLLILMIAELYACADDILKSAFYEYLQAEPSAFIQLDFTYNINSDYVLETTANGGVVSTAANFATLTTTTASGSTAIIASKNSLRFYPGQGHVCICNAIFDTPDSNNQQLVGIGTADEGFFFGYDGTTFKILHRVNATNTWIDQASWNEDTLSATFPNPSGITLDPTVGNVYKIQYKGDFGVVKFYVQDPTDGSWTLVHTIQYPNTTIISTLLNPHLQLQALVTNTATASSSVILRTQSMSAFVEGKVDTSFAGRNCVTNNLATGTNLTSTATTNIVSIQNNSMYQAKTNRILVYPDQLSVYIEPNTGTNTAEFVRVQLYIDPTVGGSPSFIEVSNPNANTSVVSRDIAGTTVTGGKRIATFYIYSRGSNNANRQRGPDGSLLVNLSDYNVVLYPGERLVLTGELTNPGNVNARASLSWKEQH